MPKILIPFLKSDQLNSDLDTPPPDPVSLPCLPGNPRIKLNNIAKLNDFIRKEFDLGDFLDLEHRLWLMSKQDSGSISPLHRQSVKNHRIIVTEDIRLHLVWHYDRIFIKPLPAYLTSHVFWEQYFSETPSPARRLAMDRERVLTCALGYLRTYTHLIIHESDYQVALKENLVTRNITFSQLSNFLSCLEHIPDSAVATRFHYGEIRLSRLNFYSKFFRREFDFQRVHGQYGSYFATFYAPILYSFGTLSLLLSAMQVGMAVEQVYSGDLWPSYWIVCRRFSITCLGVGFV